MIYLICFGASALFAQLAHKSKFKLAILLWSVLSIAITVTLAGLRDYDIGIDVDHYRTYRLYWGQASAGTFAEYMKFYNACGISLGSDVEYSRGNGNYSCITKLSI